MSLLSESFSFVPVPDAKFGDVRVRTEFRSFDLRNSACETGIRIQVFEAVNDQYFYSSHFVIFDGLNLFRILPVRNDQ